MKEVSDNIDKILGRQPIDSEKEESKMTREEIMLACDIAWQEKFLEITGHKIGDEVFCLFSSSFGTATKSYSTSVKGKGVIIRMEDGSIRIKSNEKYKHSKNVRRYPNIPSSLQTYWKYEEDYAYAKLDSMLNVRQKEE